MPKDFNNRSHAGAGIQIFIYDADGEKIVGRGTGFDWRDDFSMLPVEELGVHKIKEFVPGRMTGSGTFNTVCIAKTNDNLPYADNFVFMGPFMILKVVAEGRPNAGTILDQFTEVWFTSHAENANATGLIGKNISFVYGERIPGNKVQGVQYPDE